MDTVNIFVQGRSRGEINDGKNDECVVAVVCVSVSVRTRAHITLNKTGVRITF